MFRRFQRLPLLALQVFAVRPGDIVAAELRPETAEGFSRYVQVTGARIMAQLAPSDRFLYIDGLPEAHRKATLTTLRDEQVFMQRLEARSDSGRVITTPGRPIYRWIGDVFIPEISIGHVLEMVEDYNQHHEIYKPDGLRLRLVARNGNNFKVEMRFRKKKVITATPQYRP